MLARSHLLRRSSISSAVRVRCFSSGEGDYSFLGAPTAKFTEKFEIQRSFPVHPIYRATNSEGILIKPRTKYLLPDEVAVKCYKDMVLLHTMDQIFYDGQRQGRISFYMTNGGEEAAQLGSISALDDDDMVFTQYREAGVYLYRGYDISMIANQLYSNCHDLGKGRQMPVHYGDFSRNLQTVSSPLATQIIQASGAAYASKLEGKKKATICYFGDGAASEGDAHAAFNFAATLECPVIFFVRNNGYAISTPVDDQYRGDGIISRAAGYNMACIRVDGMDLVATHEATKRARDLAVEENVPVMVEAMTYRLGHHSTSDDSTRYREADEIHEWQQRNALDRTRLYLEGKGLWDDEQELSWRESTRKDVLRAMRSAESAKKPPLSEMFTDVYQEVPPHLQRQHSEMMAHLAKYSDEYENTLNEYLTEEEE